MFFIRKLLSGTFSQVEDAIDKKFAANAYKDAQKLNFGRLLLSGGFFIACIYGIYILSWYMSGDFEEPTVPIDTTNEFRVFLSSIWYVNFSALFLVIGFLAALAYSQENRVKSFLIMNITLSVFLFVFLIFFFKAGQLFVYSFILRMIYTVIFIAALIFVGNKIYRNAMEMVYGTKKKRSFVVEWASDNRKTILSLCAGIFGISQLSKAIFGSSVNDFETRFVGAIAEFFPLIACGCSLVLIYMGGNLIRSFYLHKFSEEFRAKFDVDKAVWYGPKHRQN